VRSALVIALTGAAACRGDRQCSQDEALELYERRIEPVLMDDQPKSCNQCHLSGVDLALFVRDTPCQTMACLARQGLVDLDDPNDSVVLDWIARADPDSELVTPEVIQAEYDGFRAWIGLHADCRDLCPEFDDPCEESEAGSKCPVPGASTEQRPVDDPNDCRSTTLELLFREKVYGWRGRCYACHFENWEGPPAEAPRWIAVGECDDGSLRTLHNVEAAGWMDLDEPSQSLLLLKPLAESAGGVWHGGHDKFADTMDPAYLDFLYFIERYAECRR
jgi:hypothetical protein